MKSNLGDQRTSCCAATIETIRSTLQHHSLSGARWKHEGPLSRAGAKPTVLAAIPLKAGYVRLKFD